MRHVKTVAGLIVALCTLGLAATPALAAEFEASKEGKFKSYKTKTEPVRQVFKLGPITYTDAEGEEAHITFKVECENATGTGEAPFPASETLTVAVRYQHCFSSGTAPDPTNHVRFVPSERGKAPATFEYSNTGSVTIAEPIVMRIAEAKCTVTIPGQTIEHVEKTRTAPEYSPASYTTTSVTKPDRTKVEKEDFPEGFQDKLGIEDSILLHTVSGSRVGLEYEVEPSSEKKPEGVCADIEKTGHVNGTYTGGLHLELPHGSLKAP